MNFEFTQDQLDLRQKLITFVEAELPDNTEHESFPIEIWRQCADFGIQGMASNIEYGGRTEELDFLNSVLAMEAFGYSCPDNGLAFGLNAQMWTVQLPILEFGTAFQKEKYLKGMAKGELVGAHALTEPNAGSDAFSMETTAIRSENSYILNGEKCMISLAPVADVVLVFAATDSSKGKWGISAFLIETNLPGVEVSQPIEKMGLNSVPMGNIRFSDCEVPKENLLGSEGAGFSISNHSLEYERCSILASQTGAMERQLEKAIKYVTKREQYGEKIGKFQSVSNRIADMKLRLETSKLLLYKATWMKQQNQSALLEVSMLKLHLSESFLDSSLDAIRTFGGYGYLRETGVEHDFRDAVGGILYAGTSDIQRKIISRLLGVK